MEHPEIISMSSQEQQPTIASLPIDEVYIVLKSTTQGITTAEANQRLDQYGPNTIQEAPGTPFIWRVLANFTHLMALLLWIGGLIALLAQLPQLAFAIWMVNLINGVFSIWQEYKAERATAALKRLLSPSATVQRNGREQRIPAEEIVPGDMLILVEGDRIAADARLVAEAALRSDQSMLTGESHPVRKTSEAVVRHDLAHVEMPNLIFAGTTIAAGTGKAVVFATGAHSEFGKIAQFTQQVGNEPSPLQKELARVTKTITIIAISVGVVFFLLAVFFANITLAEGFIFGLGMIVAFVPEGLLPTVTLALALGVQRMARRHALIKRLSAVETLGCTSVICTDKTGTLTQNEMTVCDIWLPQRALTVTGIGYAPEGQIIAAQQSDIVYEETDLHQLLTAATLCNNAHLIPPQQDSSLWSILGDPTEAALLVVAQKAGIDMESAIHAMPRLLELPFESQRKRMSTIHRQSSIPTTYAHLPHIAYVKGAPKEVLALCTHLQHQGQTQVLDEALHTQISLVNDTYARRGLRVLAVAMRMLPEDRTTYTPESVESHLTFLGLIAMTDPPRAAVMDAVATCHRAGIRIIMMTGDYGLTAESIAKRIGIVQSEHPRILTGTELEAMDNQILQQVLQEEVLFARVTPEHKLRVVRALQVLGHVVAVTGDGVNDAPALKQADIGVAMGVAGTDVAKEAADMILTDDHFASIVNAIEEGRAVYANIKKFTAYIFTSNTPEAVPFILFALSQARIPLALNVMHILAIDLGTDMVPALALGAEPPAPGVMEQPPRRLTEHVITRAMLIRAYLWLGPVQSLAAMAAFYYMYWTNGHWGQWLDLPASGTLYQAATAMALAAVVITQVGNLFAQRTEHSSILYMHFFNNYLVWIGIATELLLIVLIVYTPFLQGIIGTAAFPLWNWLFLFAWMPALVIIDEIRKRLSGSNTKLLSKLKAPMFR
ncbi:MAG: Magnesium-transporting ATPase (P-type) [Chloroflexi bacterium AL-W]|nr:Magnesium-transporting ATPase (P-type) [Chloroflexi bacterium AL-N1]NOK66381.1 Magnesium-transporting ATPase (P-type) [Chloroflexi bacterium AL-N10]NOK71769.1 Magnesium-transporting ATPase (P-type) [Chloroflexi bacterium AL-N5]NOK81026.1 Magnesium-transporting ATPase (P-type) [Chloroflexi bacterium AL-W]NOK89299.1 Magnesium-transporting ATPase (P-type) [Chloroflexi bacterium AL-N15]